MSYYETIICNKCKKNINETHCKFKVKMGFVYLMLNTTNDLFKIGYSIDPNRRLYELIHGSSNEIRLLCYFPGTKANEKIVLNKFKYLNIKREWFQNNTEISDYFFNHPQSIRVE